MLPERIAWIVANLSTFAPRVLRAPTLRASCDALTAAPGVGPFLSYEIAIDLVELGVLPFSLNDYVVLGNGAVAGVALLARTRSSSPAAVIESLRRDQRAWLDWAGAQLHGPELTLENLEQWCCESSKIARVDAGQPPKNKFDPEQPLVDPDLWDDLPERFVDPAHWIADATGKQSPPANGAAG